MVLCGLIFPACRPDPHSAQGVAERFLDAHYVRIDLQAAKAYCTGLALSRLENEIRLTADQPIDATTRQPRVYYDLIEEKRRSDARTSFLYEATIAVDGAGQFTKQLLVTLRQDSDGWRVTNYSEFD